MRINQARDAARRWVIEEASGLPGFCGAYTAGSTNWLSDDSNLKATSDLDIVVVLADPTQARQRGKFVYQDILFDVSYLSADQLHSSESVLGNYHIAASFRTTNILLDPSGRLTALLAVVRRDYARRQWVRTRCANARNKVLQYLRSTHEEDLLHDQVMAWLFAAGITTHILLVAGLRNPTVRKRYLAVRELLADYGRLEFHESLLELLGVAPMSRGRVAQHVATLTDIFDRAKDTIKTPFPFATDINELARPLAIDGSLEMIERGYHREAMLWIAVTHSRCQKVILTDAPAEMTQPLRDSYRELLADLRVPSTAEVRRRCAEVELILPSVWHLAEAIMAANREIEDD